MKITVLSIQPGTASNSWDAILDWGDRRSTVTFTRDSVMIGDRQGWAITAEPLFYETFKYNQHITNRLNQLLRRVIEQQEVILPAELGAFYTPEEAQAEITRRQETKLKAVASTPPSI
jgi:hypothetical protein